MIWLADGARSDWIMAATNTWIFRCCCTPDEEPLSNPSQGNWEIGRNLLGRGRRVVDIQLEDPRDHDDGLRAVSILQHRELEGLSSVDEESAAEPLLVLHDPMAVAVPPDAKQT